MPTHKNPPPKPPILSLLILTILLPILTTCKYHINLQYSIKSTFNITGKVLALAPKPIISSFGQPIDIAVCGDDGYLVLSSVQNSLGYFYGLYLFQERIPIQWVDWTAAGIFVANQNSAMVLNPINLAIILKIDFNNKSSTKKQSSPQQPQQQQKINYVTHAYRQNTNTILTAVSTTNNSILLFENSINIMNLYTVNSQCISMTFDLYGKYFYYIDNYQRYVIDTQIRSQYRRNPVYTQFNGVMAASNQIGSWGISAYLSSRGDFVLWNINSALTNYSSGYYKQTILKFTQNSQYLLTVKAPSTLHLWKTNFKNYTSWQLEQTVQNPLQIDYLDAQNQNIVYVTGDKLIIYSSNKSSPRSAMFFILVGLLTVVGCIGFICFIFWRRRRFIERGQMDGYYGIDNNIANNNNNNNNYAISIKGSTTDAFYDPRLPGSGSSIVPGDPILPPQYNNLNNPNSNNKNNNYHPVYS